MEQLVQLEQQVQLGHTLEDFGYLEQRERTELPVEVDVAVKAAAEAADRVVRFVSMVLVQAAAAVAAAVKVVTEELVVEEEDLLLGFI